MMRNLYRIYLYAVCIVLLIIATSTTAASLGLLLASTPLRSQWMSPPNHRQVVQAIVGFVAVWLVTLLLGGLHYWLIRRDMASDPTAGGGAARSLFLNVTQLIVAPVFVGQAAAGVAALGDRNSSPVTSFSVALATGGLFALLQWERGRTRALTRGAIALQRLHLFGAQLALVLLAIPFWVQATQTSVAYALIRTGNYDPCAYAYPGSSCVPGDYYPLRLAISQWGGALFVAACWAGYTVFSRADLHSRLRQVTHLLAFGLALALTVWQIQQIIEAILKRALDVTMPISNPITGAASQAGVLVFGVVLLLAYFWLYWREAAGLPSGVPAAGLIQLALIGVIFAYEFWHGAVMTLGFVVERIAPGATQPPVANFAEAGSVLLAGLPFILFEAWLSIRTRQTGVNWPQRAFVLVLLAAGVIVSATGLIVTLTTAGSAWLGEPPDGWQHTARTGLVILLVGVVMAAIFATVALRNQYLVARQEPKPIQTQPGATTTQPARAMDGPPSSPETLEAILDALLAGRLSRDEAAMRIRAGTR